MRCLCFFLLKWKSVVWSLQTPQDMCVWEAWGRKGETQREREREREREEGERKVMVRDRNMNEKQKKKWK